MMQQLVQCAARRLSTSVTSGVQRVESGTLGTLDYRLGFERDGRPISLWHDVPLRADGERAVFNMIVEIPRGTAEKMEMSKEEAHNPIVQDSKKGQPRSLKYRLAGEAAPGMAWNYGMFPQTWEDPTSLFHDPAEPGAAPLRGDGDPLDVVELSGAYRRGDVVPVRLLGALALVDEGELDWKIITVDDRNASWAAVQRLDQLDLAAVVHWFREYKTAEGKPQNRFAYAGKLLDQRLAESVVLDTHRHWAKLVQSRRFADFGYWCPP